MTDKPSSTPTDAELNTILCAHWPAFAIQSTLVKIWVRDALQDAIDKWGQPAQATEPVAWLRNTTDPQPHAVTNLKYRSALDAQAGVEYIPVFAAPQPIQARADGFFLLLPQRPKPEAPAGTAGLDWDAYSGAQMLAFGRDCSDAAIAALRTEQPAPSGATEEVENLRKALVYAAFALHDTPQYMLAQGIALIGGDTVRVSRDGWTVEASVNPHRQTAPSTQQAGERVYAVRPKGLADFCTCDEARYEELSNKPHLFETRIFYTAPQPSPAAPADSVPAVEREQERILECDAHRHVELSVIAAQAQSGLTDAYVGAREALSIWKRRALEAERDLRSEKQTTSRLVGELNAASGPTFMGDPASDDEIDRIHVLAAGQATAAQAGEYPALVCDYCGALTPDPWHSSGMLHGKMSKHIHSCDACAARGAAQAQDTREPLTPERVKEIVLGAGYDQCGIPDTEREAFINGLRHGEHAHGITGGQHG